jgi:hypothetical protein
MSKVKKIDKITKEQFDSIFWKAAKDFTDIQKEHNWIFGSKEHEKKVDKIFRELLKENKNE